MSDWTTPNPELVAQAIRAPGFELLTRAEIDVNTARTWDRTLVRKQRLVVPIDVQAYVVPENGDEPTVPVAGMPGDPAPFAPGDVRARGVHLHWAMPDGLLRGVQTEDGSDVEFPLLPDRWVVVRTVLPTGRERALIRGWVIDAATKVVVDLPAFTGTFAEPTDPDDRFDPLDGAFGGGLLWTASYEASAGRFGFHDPVGDLEDLRAAAPDGLHRDAASYTVCGWWSNVAEDALSGSVGTAMVDDRLETLGWYVDHEGREELFRRETTFADRLLHNAGFRSAVDDPETLLAIDGSGGTASTVPIDIAIENPVADADTVVVGPARLSYLSLLHGSVLGVPLDELPNVDARPTAGGVSVGAGLDIDDLVAALGSSGINVPAGQRELAERLAAAFTGDLIESLDSPDGLDDLAQREHDDGFWPLAGPPLPGAQADRLRAEDAGALHATNVGRKGRSAFAPDFVKQRGQPGKRSTPEIGKLRFTTFGDTVATPTGTGSDRPDPRRNPKGPSAQLQTRSVVRPAPRVFRPQAPMVGLRNVRPSHRHHGDGLYDATGKLRVRYPSEVGDSYEGVLRGADLLPTLGSGAVPPEVLPIVREALLLDPYAEAWHAAAAVAGTPGSFDIARTRLSAEFARVYGADGVYDSTGRQFLIQSVAVDGPTPLAAASSSWNQVIPADRQLVDLQIAAETNRMSVWNGTTPSPVAITTWRQPWVPMWIEWKVKLFGGRTLDGWHLRSLDFETDTADGSSPDESEQHTFVGRSAISRGVGVALHEAIHRWLATERRRDANESVLSDADEAALARLGGLVAPIDVVSASLDGVREQLLGIPYEGQIQRGEPGPDGEERPIAAGLPTPLFGGRLELAELRVVDAFGRTLDIDVSQMRTTTTLELADHPTSITLRPRLQHNARWLFRLVDPGHAVDADPLAARDAFVNQVEPALGVNPIAGFLLPDHIDEALELFDTDGRPIGQLDHDGLSGAVRWETAPGRPLPPDAGPHAELARQSHLMGRVATGLMRTDVTTRSFAEPPAESPLTALLRAIDTTLWSVDTMASIGTPSIAGLVGRPIAVVRATLRLDALDDVDEVEVTEPGGPDRRRREFETLAETRFPVRLGDLARTDDALLGFFVNDDYGHLHVVDRVVAAQATDVGRHRGHLGLLGDTSPVGQAALDHPFIVPEDELYLRPGETVRLTLLMLPGGRVHLTSGILPRKALALSDEWVRAGLQRIVPSVRVGPLLIDPGDVRLPKVHSLGEEQSFIRRTGPLTWREDPIVSATQAALLPRLPHEMQEGWIRVTPADGGDA